jgi:hypothetical protein
MQRALATAARLKVINNQHMELETMWPGVTSRSGRRDARSPGYPASDDRCIGGKLSSETAMRTMESCRARLHFILPCSAMCLVSWDANDSIADGCVMSFTIVQLLAIVL